jgi:hypothetical protein
VIRRNRSIMAGMTDYTGVSMEVILSHLDLWSKHTGEAIKELMRLQRMVEKHQDDLDGPNDILGYISYFIDLFSRYRGDFERLLVELPHNVVDAHVQIVQQIYHSSSLEERLCVNFKQDHIERRLKNEELRGLVDRIYSESRDMVIDYRDLSNLVPRLRTFVGTAGLNRKMNDSELDVSNQATRGTHRLRIFMCHAHGDKPAVRALYTRLINDGFTPWLDEEDLIAGQDWREEIPKAVRSCDVVIVCLSRTSVTKEGYVQKEIRVALDAEEEKPEGTIFIIPVRLEEIAVPNRLKRWHWINLFENNGYQKLVRALVSRASTREIFVDLPPVVQSGKISRAIQEELAEAMLSAFNEAKKLKYNAVRFFQMLSDRGAIATAKALLAGNVDDVSDGFQTLWSLQRLDLTVEAICLRPQFRGLFTEKELTTAHKRLESVGYGFQQAEDKIHIRVKMFQAERIRDQFTGILEIHKPFQEAIMRSYRQDSQSKSKAADPAQIEVNTELNMRQAKVIRDRYKNFLDSPTDRRIYVIIDNAISRH